VTGIHLMRVGSKQGGGTPALDVLDRLAAALVRVFRTSCHVREEVLEADAAFHAERNQYHSTLLLEAMQPDGDVRLLGVTALDLYVPVLTFVFGEAQLGGRRAVVSLCRLDERFYGLPANPALLERRLFIEAVHELGHTYGLRHCRDWQCAMASTHSVERLDLKQPAFCAECQSRVIPPRNAC